jgi:hypothetical protein
MVPVAIEDRLFDLVWESRFYARHGGGADSTRAARLHHEIPVLADAVFGNGVSAANIENLWSDLLDRGSCIAPVFRAAPSRGRAMQLTIASGFSCSI